MRELGRVLVNENIVVKEATAEVEGSHRVNRTEQRED